MSSTEDEIALYRGQMDRLERAIQARGKKTAIDEWALGATQRVDGVITEPNDADYALPGHFDKTVPRDALAELRELMGELRDFRRQLVGLGEAEARILYNGDEHAILIRDAFADWLSAHVRRRLARPAPRDRGDPIRAWMRMSDELIEWVDELAAAPGTGHEIALGTMADQVAWDVYQGTWGRFVDLYPEEGGTTVMLREGIDPKWKSFAMEILQLYGWAQPDATTRLAERTPELAAADIAPEAARAELAVLAADLVEVKSLLVRGYRQEDNLVALPGGWWAGWTWDMDHRAGVVAVARTEDQLRREIDSQQYRYPVRIGLDGVAREFNLKWLPLGDEALPWTVGVLRPLHHLLVEKWTKVERPAPAVEEPADAMTEGEVVAAACEVIAREDPEPEPEPDVRVRVPAVRTITLLALLERRLGCEVAQGKGSEVTVWRRGGRKFTLGRHKRNTHVPAHVVRALLKAVGIGVVEWVEAVGPG